MVSIGGPDMAIEIGGRKPPAQEEEIKPMQLPEGVYPLEQEHAIAGIDPSRDMDDMALQERGDDLSRFASLPMDEKRAILDMLQMNEDQLEPLALQASTLLGHTRESRLAREARLTLVHRYGQRGMSVEMIALKLGISTRRVGDLRKTLNERIRRQVSKIDFGLYAGEQLSFYQTMKQLALGMFEDETNPGTTRMSAAILALRAAKDEHQFLQKCGVFKGFHNGDDLLKRLNTEHDGTGGADLVLTDVAMAFKRQAAILAQAESRLANGAEDAQIVEEGRLWVDGDFDQDNTIEGELDV